MQLDVHRPKWQRHAPGLLKGKSPFPRKKGKSSFPRKGEGGLREAAVGWAEAD